MAGEHRRENKYGQPAVSSLAIERDGSQEQNAALASRKF
jgi:hypothetical protein